MEKHSIVEQASDDNIKGICALHEGYLRLQTHTQNMQYLFLFHCNSGYAKERQYYVILRILSILFIKQCSVILLQLLRSSSSSSVWLPVAKAPDVLQPCGLLYYP